jgi:1,2-diacylglycerol 3-beta-glucosyltransferase
MRSRLLAGAILLVSVGLAWLAVLVTFAARAMQVVIVLSIVYVTYLAWQGWRTIRDARREAREPGSSETTGRPWVTVVIPARDEAPVIGDAIRDLAAQDYVRRGQPAYDVIVVDDGSGDGTDEVARQAGAVMGDRFQLVRREAGAGPRTKAAALAHAHGRVRGEIVAVLDADSRVAPDYLTLAVGAWERDPGAAALQTRRVELNRDRGWLPAAQDDEQHMDLASQCGRWATDGTAEVRGTGMFLRRDVLERVGGWHEQHITEDLELSTRLAAAGEHIALAPEAVVREEAVETLGGLWRQRMRWAEGSVRRLIDIGPGLVLNGRLPIARRIDFLMFTTEFLVPPIFVATIVASMLTVALPRDADWTVPATLFVGYGAGTFLLGAAGLAATGVRGWRLGARAARGSLFLSHWLLVIPIALLKIAIWPPTIEFARTPRSPHRAA